VWLHAECWFHAASGPRRIRATLNGPVFKQRISLEGARNEDR